MSPRPESPSRARARARPRSPTAPREPGALQVRDVAPCLTFQDRAEEAMRFYVSLFEGSRVVEIIRYEADAGPIPKGKVALGTFELQGRRYHAFDGGPHFAFSEAFSMVATCADQAQLDAVWARLAEGGREGPCGWLTDRFGVSWQVIPASLRRMLARPDRGDVAAMMATMLAMPTKLDIAALDRAYRTGPAAAPVPPPRAKPRRRAR